MQFAGQLAEELAEGWELDDAVGEHRERYPRLDGQRRLVDPLAGQWSDGPCSEHDLALGVGHQAKVTAQAAAVCLGAVDRAQIGLGGEPAIVLGTGDEPYTGNLGIAEHHARDRAVVRLRLLAKDVGRGDPRLVSGYVREGGDSGDITDRPDPLRCPAVLVNLDAPLAALAASLLQAEVLQTGPAAGSEHEPLCHDLLPSSQDQRNPV